MRKEFIPPSTLDTPVHMAESHRRCMEDYRRLWWIGEPEIPAHALAYTSEIAWANVRYIYGEFWTAEKEASAREIVRNA